MIEDLTQMLDCPNKDESLTDTRPCAIGPDGTIYHSVEEIEKGDFEHQYQRENAYDELH